MTARRRARRTSPLYLPSAFDLFKPSKDLVLKYIEVFGVLYILPFIFWIHSWMNTPAHGGNYWARGSDANYGWTWPGSWSATAIGFSIFWLLVTFVIGTAIQMMMQQAQLDAAEGRKPDLGRSWRTVKGLGWRLFGLYIAMAIVIGIGLILLIIPGLFAIRRYMLAPYVMLDKKCSIEKALADSHKLSLVNTGAVWGLMGVLFLIGLIGILPLIGSLASFIIGALYSVAPAIRYQQLKKLA